MLAAAARTLKAEGARGMLVLPGDIPAVTAAEIAELLAGHGEGRAVSLVAAYDGQGTNALLASPPDVHSISPSGRAALRLMARPPRASASFRGSARFRA